MKILYDGWPLVYGGDDPAAIHLLTLLAAHPADIPASLALPGPSFHALPYGMDVLSETAAGSTSDRLRWEQRLLPALARRVNASHIHTTGGLALFGAAGGLLSPAGFVAPTERPSGLAARLGSALAQGGASRVQAWLWPDDLPVEGSGSGGLPPSARCLLPPAVHPVFSPNAGQAEAPVDAELAGLDLPETYILVHSQADPASIDHVLDAWSWAAGPIGVDYPLLWVGLRVPEQQTLVDRLAEYNLAGTARPLPPLSLPALAELYRRCSAVLHLGDISPWGDPARLAMACARPLAAYETPAAAGITGPAAYLAGPGMGDRNARTLGAALLTIIVEEGLAEALSQSARVRSENWNFDRFRAALGEFYAAL